MEPVFAAIAELESSVDGVYLVGGAVRDVLLGAESFDLDIAVEGDAIGFARALAHALGGRYTPHEKFGTAVVQYGDGSRVDVVTTRTERYHAPGALPTVEPATIAEDLHRRDFTINAMAVSLKKADFGALVHPFGGRKDLEEGVIRVLHDLSFVDDPTRILRAVRYESRYGFRLEEHTERLAWECIARGLIAEVSPVRVRDELLPLLEDSGAARGIARLGELGVDRALHPGLRGDADGAALYTRALDLRDELGLEVPAWRIGLTVLARELTAEATFDWLDALDVKHRDVDLIVGAVTFAPQILVRLRAAPITPADIVALAEPLAPDTPLLAIALEDRSELRDYFTRLRCVELEIGGAELAELGLPESPRVGELLAELQRRKLNGELDGRDSELAAARELVRGEGS